MGVVVVKVRRQLAVGLVGGDLSEVVEVTSVEKLLSVGETVNEAVVIVRGLGGIVVVVLLRRGDLVCCCAVVVGVAGLPSLVCCCDVSPIVTGLPSLMGR
jgi:hypothetical protein